MVISIAGLSWEPSDKQTKKEGLSEVSPQTDLPTDMATHPMLPAN
jgi:hypothetical protein